MNRRANLPPAKPKKQGFFGEEDDLESNLFFNNASLYRQDSIMIGSPTPSQYNFGSGYIGPTSRSIGSLGLQQRGIPNPPFPVPSTPTSNIGINAGFPLNVQQSSQVSRTQQVSPNSVTRGMFGVGQQNILSQLASQTNNLNQMKQSNALTSGLLSGSSTLSNIGTFPRQLNDGSQTGASFDWSEFPMLGSRSSAQNQIMTSRNYVNMVNKQDPTPEFQIENEDFPALPGAQNPSTSNANEASSKALSGMGSYDQAVKDSSKVFGDKIVGQQRKGIQTLPDGTITNIPGGMVTDQFGMVGLLTFIRTAETDPNLVALAPGIDLTTLGLNLNQPENLFSTFQSPWSDLPCRPQDIDCHVPPEYLTNLFIRDKLAPIRLNRYMEDLLFYLFYVNGGDLLQLVAAAELYNRDWRYHKEERVWITRAPGMEPLAKTNTYERGTYFFFDVHNWRKVPKEFYLEYSKLEDRPQLPDGITNNKA